MRQPNLLRSTPFRLALTFSFLFIVAFVLAALIVFQLLRSDLARRLDETAQATYSVVAATYSDSDLEDLVAAVNSHSALGGANEQLLSLVDASGAKIAGNFQAPTLPVGFSTLPGQALGLHGDAAYRVLSSRIGANILTVAESFSETERLEWLLLLSFGWATVIVAVLAVAGGALLASGVQRRLDLIAATMVDVSHGRLDARIPLIGRGDDIDEVSGQVNAALDRLTSLVEGMKHVSANIAHDLKTPLNRLQIILETLSEKAASGDASSADLAEAREECSRINGTFDALLRIAQIEAGARRERFSLLALREVVRRLEEAYVDVAAEAGMILHVQSDPTENGTIMGDRQLLLQLGSNLVENAIHHCPAGTAIVLSLDGDADEIRLTVADTGPGVPEGERPKVLQRLYRLEKSRTTPGSGLGLSLVKAIADLHGATLQLDDNKPGLRVTVRFARPAL